MVLAALIVFAALLVAWLLAPVDGSDLTLPASVPEPEPQAEPLAQVA